ncbi:hypothetical protein LNP04_12305 [Chryseobacterium sp. C-71]|uniref:hypothetical protein n=1 Tax=Chryseobacterium sp. C-71 TaxID=2893882 RepID=UPI001E28B945|nr:hypothetical protein [Chryseobacterium sp. C-71]UFH30757.1 hypothetical protein LNP04_12305 [Chryseobacterium sp. C-71]
MKAAILYGNYDGKGNALVIRTNNLVDPLYTIGGYLIGFTKNHIAYYHFVKSDFKNDDKNSIDAGYYSVDDWLRYWADQIKIEEVRKFENVLFEHVMNGDLIVIQKHKIAQNMINYNINEEYEYVWNSNQHLLPFTEKIYIPAGITAVPLTYNPQQNATNFFNNTKHLINQVSGDKKDELSKALVYSAYCIHHINNSILTLFAEPAYLDLITEQKNFWSNPFTDTSGLNEDEIINLVHNFYVEVLNFYSTGFRSKKKIESASQNKKFFYLTLFMGVKALTSLTSKLKLEILKSATNEMSEYFEREAVENLIVRIACSFDVNSLNKIDEFLEGLIKQENLINKEQVTLYQYIYDRMSTSWNMKKGIIQITNWIAKTSFQPVNTKSAFVQALYSLWQFSKFNPYNEDGELKTGVLYIKSLEPNKNKPSTDAFFVEDSSVPAPNVLYNYSYETAYQVSIGVHSGWPYAYAGDTEHFYKIKYPSAAPISIPYESEKRIGIFFDNFTFEFNGTKIQATQNKLPWIDTDSYFSKYSETSQLYGTYDIFQPVSLINNNIDSAVPLLTIYGDKVKIGNGNLTINSFVPVFVLKMIDDLGDKSDAETVLGYAVDGVLTLSGVGNLTKLRHLKWAALGMQETALVSKTGLRIVLGGVEFTSGVLGFFANFVECSPNDDFCKNVKNFIMLLQLATLSVSAVDTVSTLALKASARRIAKAAGGNDAITIRQNVENRLRQLNPSADNASIQQAASSIYLFSGVALSPKVIKAILKKISNAFKGKSWGMDVTYTDAFLTDYIKLCKQELGLTEDIITDLVYVANRKEPANKFITTDQLILQTKFYVNEVLKRGFSAGFSNLNDYKQFCNTFRNKLKQNFSEMPKNLSHYFDDAEFVVQGSGTRTWKIGDPEPPAGLIKPTKQPEDIDIGVVLQPWQYDAFQQELIKSINQMIDTGTINKKQGALIVDRIRFSNDKIMYRKIFDELEINNKNFLEELRESCKDFTNFDAEGINFAIIKKYDQADLKPAIDFKY